MSRDGSNQTDIVFSLSRYFRRVWMMSESLQKVLRQKEDSYYCFWGLNFTQKSSKNGVPTLLNAPRWWELNIIQSWTQNYRQNPLKTRKRRLICPQILPEFKKIFRHFLKESDTGRSNSEVLIDPGTPWDRIILIWTPRMDNLTKPGEK